MKYLSSHLHKMRIYYMLPIFMIALYVIYKTVFSYFNAGAAEWIIATTGEYSSKDIQPVSHPLPNVLAKKGTDLTKGRLKLTAARQFAIHKLPDNLEGWKKYRSELKQKILQKTGAAGNPNLPLNVRETGSVTMKGYSIRNLAYQSLRDIYATANLYVPEGNGPFPAVIHMIGHWNEGKIGEIPQGVGHSLAQNGYVVLVVDPWGAGERASVHGVYEYHGANLGASMLNIGESLMGVHIAENVRGVDLLSALPYVDATRIGATGASGGGNQTMWLAAIDERIKAAVTVVSVGTFESYVMGHNCICETLIDGLTFTEEAGVLAMVAPRALAIYNGQQDSNPAFYPSEMLRSYTNAQTVFGLYGAENNLKEKIFDLPHGYHPEMREAMVGWFDLHLKGNGSGEPVREAPFELVPEEQLMVFPAGKRDADVLSTETYCRLKGKELRDAFLSRTSHDKIQLQTELRKLLNLHLPSTLTGITSLPSQNGWDLFVLETSDDKIIPVLHRPPDRYKGKYTILSHAEGKSKISSGVIDGLISSGVGLAIIDFSGTGEMESVDSRSQDDLAKLHTMARSELWLGRTVIGEWVKELGVVVEFLGSNHKAEKITIDGTKEAGLAGLFYGAVGGKSIEQIVLRQAPVSYLFESRDGLDYFSMGIHVPEILRWGDVSLAAALTGKDVTFIKPLTMSGKKVEKDRLEEYRKEFDKLRHMMRQSGSTGFIE